MRPFILAFFILLSAGAVRAAAFTCTLSPDKSAVIVKVSNPYAQQTACTVTCNFVTPDGIASVSCTQTVPGEFIALANKLARMVWAMMTRNERYKEPLQLSRHNAFHRPSSDRQ